jgi:DNA helicase HerA-like ATPase
MLLETVLAWTRRQAGSTSLRALVYFDEVFGYMPPTAAPPTKKPLLTLLKQARAFGVGVMLVTQNPMDVDYKGLTNTGLWIVGRLQTDRDKARVLEALERLRSVQATSTVKPSPRNSLPQDATVPLP